MQSVDLNDCPRESDAWWSDDGAGSLTFVFTPVPAMDGGNYVRVSECLLVDSKWPAAMEAAMRAGWKFEAVARVRYTDQVLCEVKPIPPEVV